MLTKCGPLICFLFVNVSMPIVEGQEFDYQVRQGFVWLLCFVVVVLLLVWSLFVMKGGHFFCKSWFSVLIILQCLWLIIRLSKYRHSLFNTSIDKVVLSSCSPAIHFLVFLLQKVCFIVLNRPYCNLIIKALISWTLYW